MTANKGKVVNINGNLVSVEFDGNVSMNEICYVHVDGRNGIRLKGEVIRIRGDIAQIQIYELANGIKSGDKVEFTGNMLSAFKKCGFKDITSSINLSTGSGLKRGDVLLNRQKHTAMYCGNGYEVEASINEKGGAIGGKPGDQTGREFLKRTYRNFPWTHILRYTDEMPKPVETVTKPDTKIDTVKEVQIWLNNNYSSGLTLDGLYGSITKKALVKALQKELGFVGKDIDGEYGIKTNAKVKVLRKGNKGNLVKVLQALLVCNGQKAAYVDGDFGSGTEQAVKTIQALHKIEVDGEAGKDTFSKLCK